MRIRHVLAVALCAGLAAGCSSGSDTETATSAQSTSPSTTRSATETSSAPRAPSPFGSAVCGPAFLSSLSGRQKLAQLLTVGVTGTADARAVVESEQIGGIFIGSWTDEAMLANREVVQVADASSVPLMVTIDEEGGRVSRIDELFGPDPSAREVARTKTPEQTYQMALDRGRRLNELGITVNFAPDVDVSSQPDDAVIGDRSWSDDPQVVTEYADAYARGMRDAGILPVLKHFPGHGSASGDSHTGAVTTPPLDQLQKSDLVPYRELVDTGVGVMLGHLSVPGLTKDGLPASLSPEPVALLREGTGYGAPPFTGPIFTDDLSGMKAITDRFDIAEAVEQALASGVTVALWLTTDDVPRVLDHLEEAVASGRLPADQVDRSVLTAARAKGAVTC
ncbi:glycoside hydrolase family 3 N-terminal domain-containing protein [Rhodococcus sp. SGAir0479]|uniref:glycoside hydrolase family 3 N-terminal domain-containing protein n=1 Tax=Rhodococcus sp. SGAir0479 TaxID=2567884 RepID=UPI0010CCDD68|nr:glycoside hydrolase family 3 N-terminal domain-containing protein [Rhodococcus sp. SGAir0479]QCQ92591.1 glycoside hydrolase family 3 protein [Rhodococcus sp. SGAir0479]